MNPESRPGWLERVLSLDLRSLALFRILLGIFTTGDVLHRLLDFRALYSDFGALPRSAVTGEYATTWHFSLHLASDAIWWRAGLFAACALAGLAMAIGYRTWVATFVAWVLVISLQNRNEAAMDGGDMVQRLLLFWSLFLPTAAIWSVDAWRRRGGVSTAAPTRPWLFGPATAALNIQMASIFFFAALLKRGAPWRENFQAVWYVLNWDVYTTTIGVWLRQFHDFLRAATIGTLIVEGIFPLLLFTPWAPVRVFALVTLISLHVGFVVAMKLFMFASIMILGWASLMPGWFWDKLSWGLELSPGWQARISWLSDKLPERSGSAWDWSALERFPSLTRCLALFCLIYVTCWNVRTVSPRFARVFPHSLNWFGSSLRLDQHWIMFAPAPVTEDGWFVVPGRLADGRVVDVFRDGAPLSWERPPLVADSYINRRWRRFLWTVTEAKAPGYRRYYAAYLCRDWERRHEDEVLERFNIVLMHEMAMPDYTVTPPDRMILLEDYACH